MSALATAAIMLLIYVPLSITHWVGIDVFAIHFAFFMMIPYGLGIITGVHAERRELEGPDSVKKGMHWIPAMIIVFFILLAVVDSVIISFATSGLKGGLAKMLLPEGASDEISKNISSQFTGAVVNDNQDEEQRFDEYVKKLKKQRERGWKISGGWKTKPIVNQPAVFQLSAKTKQGKPIEKADVTVEFRRAAAMRYDKAYPFKEESAGHYATTITLPLAGCWKMHVLVKKGADEHEILGETEVSLIKDGKVFTPECIDGEPDVDEKSLR